MISKLICLCLFGAAFTASANKMEQESEVAEGAGLEGYSGYEGYDSYDSSYGRYGKSYDKPSYDKPSYKKPSYKKPSYKKPSYKKHNSYHEPSYREPSYEHPSYKEPSYYEKEPYYCSAEVSNDTIPLECQTCPCKGFTRLSDALESEITANKENLEDLVKVIVARSLCRADDDILLSDEEQAVFNFAMKEMVDNYFFGRASSVENLQGLQFSPEVGSCNVEFEYDCNCNPIAKRLLSPELFSDEAVLIASAYELAKFEEPIGSSDAKPEKFDVSVCMPVCCECCADMLFRTNGMNLASDESTTHSPDSVYFCLKQQVAFDDDSTGFPGGVKDADVINAALAEDGTAAQIAALQDAFSLLKATEFEIVSPFASSCDSTVACIYQSGRAAKQPKKHASKYRRNYYH